MSNMWNQQPDGNHRPENQPPTGNLLRNYQQQFGQHSPVSTPSSQGANSYSQMSPSFSSQSELAPRRSGLLSSAQQNGWVANTMQTVRRWSGKMAAVTGNSYQPPQQPLELYRPSSASDPNLPQVTPPRPWKRSRTLRITRQMRQRRVRWQRGHPRWGIVALITLLLLIVVLGSSGSAYAYSFYESQMPRVQNLAGQQISQTTRIYDRNGVLLNEAFDLARRTPISYKDLPQIMQDAMIAAEDHTFWTNSGVDPQGILRAATSNYGGGSTLTQQVVKNLTHDDQYSYTRKLTEATLAIGLTQQYPKEKILEMYFNVAPFGANTLGIEAAVEEYFQLMPQCTNGSNCKLGITQLNYNAATRKNDPLLGLARASLLAGIPQQPPAYDPTFPENKERYMARQAYVLDQMMQMGQQVDGLGAVTPDVIAKVQALTAKMTFARYKGINKAPHFVQWVKDQVINALGNGDYEVGQNIFLTGGFNITTTIDINLESYVENSVKRHLTQPDYQMFKGVYAVLNRDNNVNDAAVVVMNSKTGEILAMNGSSDYYSTNPKVRGNVNAAISPLGPGSTFKPIVYATTFQLGWSPGTVLPDFQTYFPNGSYAGASSKNLYSPPDYGHTPMKPGNNFDSTIRVATAMSLNIPAVKAMSFAGAENVMNTARAMGITSLDAKLASPACKGMTADQCIRVATVLGTESVPLLQMTGAYQTFANQGMHVPPQGVLNITDNYGHTLYHFDPTKVQGTQALSKQVAYMMTSVLADEHARQAEFAGDHDLSFWDWDPTCRYRSYAPYPDCQVHQVAAKTGTTDNFKDNWTIGYTPNVVVGTWVGNANGEPMKNVLGITGAAPIWHSVMEFVSGRPCQDIDPKVACTPLDRGRLGLTQPNTFAQPDGIRQVCISAVDGLMATQGGQHCDWVINGLEPLQAGVAPVDPNTNNNGNNGNGNGNGGNGGGTPTQ